VSSVHLDYMPYRKDGAYNLFGDWILVVGSV